MDFTRRELCHCQAFPGSLAGMKLAVLDESRLSAGIEKTMNDVNKTRGVRSESSAAHDVLSRRVLPIRVVTRNRIRFQRSPYETMQSRRRLWSRALLFTIRIHKEGSMSALTHPRVISSKTLIGESVENPIGENLGTIQDILIDVSSGRIAYAVLSFGGFLGFGSKLFALPWSALKVDIERNIFVLEVPRERLEKAPGFDKDAWPDMADPVWAQGVHSYYGVTPYWERT